MQENNANAIVLCLLKYKETIAECKPSYQVHVGRDCCSMFCYRYWEHWLEVLQALDSELTCGLKYKLVQRSRTMHVLYYCLGSCWWELCPHMLYEKSIRAKRGCRCLWCVKCWADALQYVCKNWLLARPKIQHIYRCVAFL